LALPLILVAAVGNRAGADSLDEYFGAIGAVGPLGQGSAQARKACNELANGGPERLPRLLAAMDTPNIVAANWFRAAYERIVARELAKPVPNFPRDELKSFVRDSRHQGRPRRLALALVDRIEPTFSQTLIPTLLDDVEFRDDAVAVALKRGDDAKAGANTSSAKQAYQTAFEHARSANQVTEAARKLESLGEKVSIVRHLGLLTDWQLIGPFPAAGMSGFRTAFPPESHVELHAPVTTADQKTLHWFAFQTSDPLGTVDLVRAFGPTKEAVAYAYADLSSPSEQEAQVRCSADDCLAVWLNGQKVFGREMWLNGTRLDRFIAPVRLKPGRNRVLVKICQGPQHRDPSVTNAWTFQLRFCRSDGDGLRLDSGPPNQPTAKK